jgi:hypothetical protein
MLNNVGLPGMILLLLLLIIGLSIWLIVRSSKRKSRDQARIAEALEDLAKTKK